MDLIAAEVDAVSESQLTKRLQSITNTSAAARRPFFGRGVKQ